MIDMDLYIVRWITKLVWHVSRGEIMFYNEGCSLVPVTVRICYKGGSCIETLAGLFTRQLRINYWSTFTRNPVCRVQDMARPVVVVSSSFRLRWRAQGRREAGDACLCTSVGRQISVPFFGSSGLGNWILLELVPFRPSKPGPRDASCLTSTSTCC